VGRSSQFVVIATALEPVAAPPPTRVKLTVEGVAEIDSVSARVAFNVTVDAVDVI
jgi:hypothetical protein